MLTHDIKLAAFQKYDIKLAAFRRQRKLLQHLNTKDNERNLCQNLLRFGLKSARAALCKWATQKLLQTRQCKQKEAITNYQK